MPAHPLSQLTYSRFQDPAIVPGAPTIITLHGQNDRGRHYEAYARAAAPNGRLLGLESYKAIFAGKVITGYTWYPGPLTTPPPPFFGDALMELERFLLDEVDRQHPNDAILPFLVGVEQGAIMALAAALAVPDLLSGVIAVQGRFPIVAGWDPPLAPMEQLPIMIVDPVSGIPPAHRMLADDDLVNQLRSWGADAERRIAPDDEIPASIMSSWISEQRIRTLARSAT